MKQVAAHSSLPKPVILTSYKIPNRKDDVVQGLRLIIFVLVPVGFFFGSKSLSEDSRGLIILFRFSVVFSPGH